MSSPEAPDPAPAAAARPSRRFRRKKPLVVAAVVLASLLAGSVAVGARSNDAATGYRTATAGTHEVDQVLDSVGTVEPVSQASVAFPVDGTVSTVDVEVGDTVTVGQELASLDVEDLTATLHEKQAALEQAELTLSLALAGEDVSAAAAGGTPSGGGLGRSAGSGASSQLAAAQQAVLDAQQAVDAAMTDAQAALDTATTVCAATDATTATTTSTTTADATTADTTPAADDLTACQSALAATLAAQQEVTAAQQQLNEAADALTTLLEQEADETSTTATDAGSSDAAADSSTSAPSGSAGSTGTPSGSDAASSGTPSTGADSGTSSSPSAEDLIAYQKAVDAAALEVTVAEQAVAQATIVSPIEGTVVSVGLEAGDDATAASSTQAIVIVGEGGVEVTTSVSVTDLPDVEVGQSATVVPDGSDEELAGEVVRIGAAADSTSSYSVTISLTGDASELGNGSTASVAIVTDAAGEALAVPTSAISVDGDTATVQTIEDGEATTTTTVEVGAVGRSYTEITSGLDEGDEVVLADLSEPLPSAATSSSNGSSSGSGAAGGFPGGGMGAPPGMGGN